MKNVFWACAVMLIPAIGLAQEVKSTRIQNSANGKPIPEVKVYNKDQRELSISDENGMASIYGESGDSIIFRSFGFESETIGFSSLKSTVELKKSQQVIDEVSVVASQQGNPGASNLDALTLKLLPLNNAQELLRTVSGLFIAQHAGGGKAEQIFLRGFDNDHGTDFAVYYDGMPVNIANHAHGQGYADMHFIIPETIQGAEYYKGPHELKNGNFAVSGAARYRTKAGIERNMVKLELGDFQTQRAVAMMNFTPRQKLFSKKLEEQSYVAVEGNLSNSFFESSQKFKKISTLYRYSIHLGSTQLNTGLSYFSSHWNASGQIPLRAVESGQIGWFGAIDDSEGGNTARGNVFLRANTRLKGNQQLENFAYYNNNAYTLYSNFTFFLDDSINGDMIDQRERRHMMGYQTTYKRFDKIGKTRLTSEVAVGVKHDIATTSLHESRAREILRTVNNYEVWETNYQAYIKESWNIRPKVTIVAGTRFDLFTGRVDDLLDTTTQKNVAHRFSPKVSLFYNPTETIQFFAKVGYGYHSNYVAAATDDRSISALPRASGVDVGAEFKIGRQLAGSIVLWGIQSDAEYVFVADAGGYENNGRSQRVGVDASIKFQPWKSFIFDWSGNYSYGTLLDEPADANKIPSAPRFNSTAALIYSPIQPLSIYVGGRFMARRPLVEDESVWADEYFLLDANINYAFKNGIQLGVSVQNILNERWMEAVFYDDSRLQHETEAVGDFHFTPGTPRFIKGSITYSF